VGDFDEGQGDEDADGRPNFLDPDSDGIEGPRVRNLTATRIAAGLFEVDFDLFSPATDPVDLLVEYVEGEAAPVILSGLTGDLSNVLPGPDRSITWDASLDLPDEELSGLQLRLTPVPVISAMPELVELHAGSFTQGCPACAGGDSYPPFPITHDAYEIGKYEVTNLELSDVLDYAYSQGYLFAEDGDPYSGGDVYHGGQMLLALSSPESQVTFAAGDFAPKTRDSLSMDEHPAVYVTWYGAVAYCNWRSEMNGLTPAYALGGDWRLKYPYTNGYRLPTEAEWERASSEAIPSAAALYGFGAAVLDDSRANYQEANPLALTGEPFTTPTGYYDGGNATVDSPSPAGAYDLSGNVAEWVHDQFAPYQERDAPLHNPRGSDTRPRRVIKGGSWSDDPAALEYASRENRYANHASNRVGFRVARAAQSGSGKTAPFDVDTRAPFIESIAPVEAPEADVFEFAFLVKFSEPVDGLDLSMFSLSISGIVEVAPSIVSWSGSGSDYTVTVATGVMQGDLSLVLDDPGTFARDAGDNPLSALPVSSAPVSIDTLAPAVYGIELIGTPGLREEQVQFLITFSKPVIEVVAGDFAVPTSGELGTAPAVLSVVGSGTSRTVTVSVNQLDGLLGLAISDGDGSIQDAENRPLGRTVDSGLVHVAETVPPELLSFEVLGAPLPNAGEIEIGVFFSEPVTGLGVGNFSLSLPGRVDVAAQITGLSGSDATYNLQVATGDIESGIGLAYAPDGVADLAGNGSSEPQDSGVLIAIDTIPPLVESIELVGTPDANAASVTFEVLFSEPVLEFSADDLIPEPQGTISISPEVSGVSGTSTLYTVTMTVGEMEGSLGLGFVPESVTDLSGNAAIGRFDSGSSHAADTRAPQLLSVTSLTSSPTASDSVDFRLEFSEPVGGLNGEGGANLLIETTGLSYGMVDTRFDGNLSTFVVTVGDISNGSGTLSLSVRDATSQPPGAVKDQNGNPLSAVAVPQAEVAIDRTPPSPRCRVVPLSLNVEGVAIPNISLFNAGSTDDGGGPVTVLSVSPDSFGCEDLGLNGVSVTLSDELGNVAQCNTFVIVIDTLGGCVDPIEGEGSGEAEGEGEGALEGEGEGVIEGEGEGEPPTQSHSGDWNGQPDGRFDLTELLRIIQLYNAGSFCCNSGTEDGYAPGDCKGEVCERHDADYADPPWVVSLSELLRAVQLFNLGSFETCPEGESEDGFCLPE
jgi:formylglycine-generating enzyme required for sulfatase activity